MSAQVGILFFFITEVVFHDHVQLNLIAFQRPKIICSLAESTTAIQDADLLTLLRVCALLLQRRREACPQRPR
jgi:hypothetical protein